MFPESFKIGPVNLAPATVLAPMVGVTDTVFRRMIRSQGGCGLIMTEFTKLKAFRGLNSYTIRDTGHANIPHTVLVPDVQRKVWKFLD